MELFEQLRRKHGFGVGTIAGVAAKFGAHRRVVRRAIASALPPQQHYPERVKPKLGAVADFIDKVLGKAIPYGIYDIAANVGCVSVGISNDTAQFAVNSIRRWLDSKRSSAPLFNCRPGSG